MKIKNIFLRNSIRRALAAGTLAVLAGCKPAAPPAVNYAAPVPPPSAAMPVVAAAAPVEVADDYVYYPGYEVYYSPAQRIYWYRQGDAWASGPVAPGVSVEVLQAAPSARMDFHDSPANHHTTVVRQYPRDWRPPAGEARK